MNANIKLISAVIELGSPNQLPKGIPCRLIVGGTLDDALAWYREHCGEPGRVWVYKDHYYVEIIKNPAD